MSSRRKGLVSVVLTSWNRKAYLTQCLTQLAHQTYPNIEIIIVDDGSSDGTVDVIQKWKRRLPLRLRHRVVFARMPRNTGYSGALTTAMFLARGEFVATHDSDDFSHRDRIRRQVRYLRQHPHIGLVGTNYRSVKNGRVSPIQPNWLAFGPDRIRRCYQRGGHCITCGSLMFRGRLFDRLGGLNRRFVGSEDKEFVTRFSRAGVKMDNLREVLYYVRSHPAQRSRKYHGKHR